MINDNNIEWRKLADITDPKVQFFNAFLQKLDELKLMADNLPSDVLNYKDVDNLYTQLTAKLSEVNLALLNKIKFLHDSRKPPKVGVGYNFDDVTDFFNKHKKFDKEDKHINSLINKNSPTNAQ